MTQDIFDAIRTGDSIWIGDGGGTKAHWMAFSGSRLVAQIITKGFNPHHNSEQDIEDRLNAAFAGFRDNNVPLPVRIGYYGAGCGSDKMCGIISRCIGKCVRRLLRSCCPLVEVDSDIVLACKAVAGHTRCLMIILGTGSNTVVWDGERSSLHIPPLGYLLGDEGSGAAIGRRIIANVLRDRAPEEVREAVCGGRPYADLQAHMYDSPTPATVMADVVKTVAGIQNLSVQTYIDGIARTALEEFFSNIVDSYPRDSYDSRLCFTGSISVMYQHIIEGLAKKRSLTVFKTAQRPLEAFLYSLGK